MPFNETDEFAGVTVTVGIGATSVMCSLGQETGEVKYLTFFRQELSWFNNAHAYVKNITVSEGEMNLRRINRTCIVERQQSRRVERRE